MCWIVMLLTPDIGLPATKAVERFPPYWVAFDQMHDIRYELRRLTQQRYLYGWEDGLWDTLIEIHQESEEYWNLLQQAHLAHMARQNFKTQLLLAQIKKQIGPERFLKGWHPPTTPEAPQP